MTTLPADLQATADAVGLEMLSVLHRTDKALLATGTLAGHEVAVKCLLDADPFWAAKWRHELGVYQVFADSPPPLRVPRLLYTDGARILVLEWLDGHRLDDDRYPSRTLPAEEIDSVLNCVHAFNAWTAPAARFEVVFDYVERANRYHGNGYLTDADHHAVLALLGTTGPVSQINHGDPLPSNVLLDTTGAATLLDWEFTGLFLPGFDLAMLHTTLGGHTPAIRDRIDDAVIDAGIERAFAVNLAVVLTRELRIHHELADGPLRDARLPLIEAAWHHGRDRLHRLATSRP
jgi:hypothetical protein